MAEKQLQLIYNGQQIQQADINQLGETAGLADDRVFAELLRMRVYDGASVSKGILPPSAGNALIAPNGATGSVVVNPFRGFIGSRTTEATDALKNLRDARSALSVTEGATYAQTVQTLATNASGNPRWDLVYAAIAVDSNAPTVSRKVKDPATAVITTQSVVPNKVQALTISVLTGTASATPSWPTTPTDSAGTYYIPLGYVRVPTGFTASSTVLVTDVALADSLLTLSPTTGGNSSSVASTCGGSLATSVQQSWGSSGTRPTHVMAPSSTGGETVWAVLDLTSSVPANHSHAVDTVIDGRDWRKRLCSFMACIGASTSVPATSSTANGFTGTDVVPNGYSQFPINTGNRVLVGMGQTLTASSSSSSTKAIIARIDTGVTDLITAAVTVYVDMSDGKLKMTWATNPRCSIILKLDFSSPIVNR